MAEPNSFRVSPSLQGLPNLTAPNVESAGPAMLVKAGEAVQRVGTVGGEIYRAELRELNATRVTEGLTQLTEYQHALTYGDGGWASQQGANAVDREVPLDEDVGKQFENRADAIALGLGNEAQRTLFRQRAMAMGADLSGRVQSHVAQQNIIYKDDTLVGKIESGQRLMGTATMAVDIGRARDETLQAATTLADIRGVPDEARDTFYREMLTPGHLGALSRMMTEEDIDGSEAYFNEHRDELTYEASVKIETALVEQRVIKTGADFGLQLATTAGAANAAASPQNIMVPVAGAVINSAYGPRGNRMHKGVDFQVGEGTQVHAGASGVASIKDDPEGFGKYIELKLDDGTRLRYAHLSGVDIEDGDRVNAGQVVGRSGGRRGAPGAGNSTGPHLHYEVIGPDGAHVDPAAFHSGRPRVTPSSVSGMSLADQILAIASSDMPDKAKQEAERVVRSVYGAQRETEQRNEETITSRAYAEIDRTGTLSAASRSAIVAADMGNILPSLRSFEDSKRTRAQGGTLDPYAAATNYGIVREQIAAGNITSPEQLLPYAYQLDDADYKSMIKELTDSPQAARQQADAIITTMNEEIEGTGLFMDKDGKKTAETRKEYSNFVGAVTRQIEAERALGPVTEARQREIVLGMVAQQVISATGETHTGYDIANQYRNIPQADRLRITRSLQRADIPVPSQRQVVSTWLRLQGK